MHKLADVSLRNRPFVALVCVAASILGLFSLTSMRQELIPQIDLPSVSVIAISPGATSEQMSERVAVPIEQQVASIPEVTNTTANSTSSYAMLTVELKYGTELSRATAKIEQAVSRVESSFPDDTTIETTSGGSADIPLAMLGVTTGADALQTAQRVRSVAIPQLEKIEGVASVMLIGAPEQQVTIDIDQIAAANAGLTETALADALENNGLSIPVGTVASDGHTLDVTVGEKLQSLDDLRALPLETVRGRPTVTLDDIATVELSPKTAAMAARVNSKDAVALIVTPTASANIVSTSQKVHDALDDIQPMIGDDAEFSVIFDQAPFITLSIESLTKEGAVGLVMAVLVILLFLLSMRSTLVTAISIPLSLLLAFIGMKISGYTLNVLTMSALTITIGRVVDDSIVVIENIKRHIELGGSKRRAITTAVREVASAVTASTIVTSLVYVPVAFVSGMVGQLFKPFALTVVLAMVASLVVSLTIVPVLAYWFVKPSSEEKPLPSLAQLFAKKKPAQEPAGEAKTSATTTAPPTESEADTHADDTYANMPPRIDSFPTTFIPTVTAPLRRRGRHKAEPEAAAPIILPAVEEEVPQPSREQSAEQQSSTDNTKSAPADTPAQVSEAKGESTWLLQAYTPALVETQKRPVATLVAALGVLALTFALFPFLNINLMSGTGQNFVSLSQAAPAGTDFQTLVAHAEVGEKALKDIAGVDTVTTTVGAGMMTGGDSISYFITTDPEADQEELAEKLQEVLEKNSSGDEIGGGQMSSLVSSTIDVDIIASDDETLTKANDALLKALETVEGAKSVSSNLQAEQPSVKITVERAIASAIGLTENDIVGMIASQMFSSSIGQITLDNIDTEIYVKLDDPVETFEELTEIEVGGMPLTSVAAVQEVNVVPSVTTVNGQRTATISVEPSNPDDLRSLSNAVADAVDSVNLPEGAMTFEAGAAEELNDMLSQLGLALLAAILLIYVTLVWIFKSLGQPLLLLVSIPFAAIGSFVALLITRQPLGVAAMVGLLMLTGIVVTNAIVLIDLINQYRRDGMDLDEAINLGAQRRVRPIVMTAISTIAAMIPMALGISGQEGFISQPMAVTVIGGLFSSTVLTLVLLPVLYRLTQKNWTPPEIELARELEE